MVFSLILTGCTTNVGEVEEINVNSIEDVEETSVEPLSINIGFVDGIPALSMAKLASEKPKLQENARIHYELIQGSDLIVSKVMNKEVDIAIVPSNLASVLYNQQGAYAIGALSGFGNLYIVSREEFQSLEDLKGKEVTTIGKGLTPDIVFQYVLKENNIDPINDIKINYMGGATELAPAFISKKAEIILAPEPMISTILSKDTSAKVQFSLNDLYSQVTGSRLGFPQTVLIVKKELVEKQLEFIDAFLNAYEGAVQWAIENPKELENYAISLGITIPEGILNADSINRMNLNFIDGKEMKEVYMEYIKVLFEFEPKTVGGKLPNEQIFIAQ